MSASEPLENLVSRVVQLLKARGREREVAVLAAGRLSQVDRDEQLADGTEFYLRIGLPLPLYEQLDEGQRSSCGQVISATARELPVEESGLWMRGATIYVEVSPQDDWRSAAFKWLRGEGINNQGRVRSDNMPSREEDGLLFRSRPEVYLYRALKSRGVLFAPLPVFLRGGAEYQRIEPDFVVVQDKALMLVEVDGDTVHLETPADADARTRMFKLEGAYIERVKTTECDTVDKAAAAAKRLLDGFSKWRGG